MKAAASMAIAPEKHNAAGGGSPTPVSNMRCSNAIGCMDICVDRQGVGASVNTP